MTKDPFSTPNTDEAAHRLANDRAVQELIGGAASGLTAAQTQEAYLAGQEGGPEATRRYLASVGGAGAPPDAGMRVPQDRESGAPSPPPGGAGQGMRSPSVGARVVQVSPARVMNAPQTKGPARP